MLVSSAFCGTVSGLAVGVMASIVAPGNVSIIFVTSGSMAMASWVFATESAASSASVLAPFLSERETSHLWPVHWLNCLARSPANVSGALLVSNKKYNVDLFIGIGGGPEGVLAATALDSLGCYFQGRFIFDTDDSITRAKLMGIEDTNKKYEIKDIIKGDSIFCATGITSGDLVNGVKIKGNKYITETLITHKSSNLNRILVQEDTIKT